MLSPLVSAQEQGVGRVCAARDLKTRKTKAPTMNNKATKAPTTTKANGGKKGR